MAAFMLARQSARAARQTLFYVQTVDQAKAIIPETNTAQFYEDLLRIPSIQKTRRLPPVVLFHYGMRVRLTITIQQPFAVQDVEGTVVGFDPDPADLTTKSRLRSASASHTAEFACPFLPTAIYVKLDECDLHLPSAALRALAAPVLHSLASWPSGLSRARSNTSTHQRRRPNTSYSHGNRYR